MPITVCCDACGAECGGFGNEWHKGEGVDGHLTLCLDCSRRVKKAVTQVVASIRMSPKRAKMSLWSRILAWP